MKILLTTAPDEGSPWNQGSFPPLGLLFISAKLRDVPGMEVRIDDAYAQHLTIEQTVSRTLSHRPDIVGVSITSGNILEAKDLLSGIKSASPDIVTVCGGIHPTLFDELILREIPSVDFVLRGEADDSFPELCRRLSSGRSVENLPGLSYRSDGRIIRGELQLIEDLDSLPFVDRSVLNLGLYGTQWYGWKLPDLAGKIATVFTSRGCPFNCLFCSMVKFCDRKFRARSAKNIFQELQVISDQGYDIVILFDDNFTVNHERVEELAQMLLQHPLKLRFGFAGTLHSLPQALLHLMQRAGFDFAFVGAESGSDTVLAQYRKPASPEAIGAGILRAKKAHMFTIASFIVGAPFETESDFLKTLDFVREFRPHICDVSPLMVHPGSSLWEELRGTEHPPRLEDSESRTIWRFTSEVDETLVQKRISALREVFFQTYQGPFGVSLRRIAEILDHLIYNKCARQIFRFIIKDWRAVKQLRTATGNR